MCFEKETNKQPVCSRFNPESAGTEARLLLSCLCTRNKHRSSVQPPASIRRDNREDAVCQLWAALQQVALGYTCLCSQTAVKKRQEGIAWDLRDRGE